MKTLENSLTSLSMQNYKTSRGKSTRNWTASRPLFAAQKLVEHAVQLLAEFLCSS